MILLVLVCMGSGLYLSVRVHERIVILEKIHRFFTVVQSKISYAVTPTDILLAELAQEEFSDFVLVQDLNKWFSSGISFSEAWKRSMQNLLQKTPVQVEDISYLYAFGNAFGATDKNGQIENCAYFAERLFAYYSMLCKREKDTRKLYRALGVFLGLFLLILFI